ncbi:SEC24-related protein family [Trichomonas vaginalis G3]|uniref:SEC24-related protein family n=1 Tax=Trichomonas vaginalis (strain ATCC PRA-98 / G3) TaxID=412133 RepID=UPI0021E57B67|nr:SEC24-related protein family [Trichomonas vaginalis G3]KAI5497558.1 SEC24-related protein family [Trichomonas vaginalis G3]
MSEEIDISALSTITDFTGGEFILLEKNQFNEIEKETSTLCNAIQMRCSLKTLENIRIESSFGFRPKNPDKFSLYSTESVIFPLSLVGLGKKSVPFQLIITYISHEGRKRMRVFTRHLDLTDSMSYVFNESYKDVILKYIASFLAEKALQNEKDFEMKARNILWPIFFDYQTHGLYKDKPDQFKLIYPKNLENLVYEVVSLLHFSGFSESTPFYRKLYQLRRLSTAKLSFLEQIVNSKIIDLERGQEIEQKIDNFDQNKIYTLYDGFTTYIWGNSKNTSLDQSQFQGAVSLVNPANDNIMRERMVYEDTPYSSSLSNFSEKLLDDVFTEGHKFVLHLTEEEMKRLEDAF